MTPSSAPPPWPDLPYWVFAYGSLIWNPGFAFEAAEPARLQGWHRRFCLYSHRYRGTPERPGLVLGLDRGGSCRGIAYRVAPGEVATARQYLWQREMVSNAYAPRRVPVRLADQVVQAETFTIRRDHGQYAGMLDEAQVACLIATSEGARGCNRSYLENTLQALAGLGVRDRSLERTLKRVEAFQRDGCPPRPNHPVFDVGV